MFLFKKFFYAAALSSWSRNELYEAAPWPIVAMAAAAAGASGAKSGAKAWLTFRMVSALYLTKLSRCLPALWV